MGRKYLAFDIETSKIIPGTDFDWHPHRPLGIACAATLPCDSQEPTLWYSAIVPGSSSGKMSQAQCRDLVAYLEGMVVNGYTVLTWNGLGFDFDVLSEESGLFEECRSLAMYHVDMMFHVYCNRGFPVSLAKVAEGLGIEGKSTGIVGEAVPQMWASGRRNEVLAYVSQDVRITLQIADLTEKCAVLSWITKTDSIGQMELKNGWLTVQQANCLPAPDTSWMMSQPPIPRHEFTGWLEGRSATNALAINKPQAVPVAATGVVPEPIEFYNKVIDVCVRIGTVTTLEENKSWNVEFPVDAAPVKELKFKKSQITQTQKELRHIKKEISLTKARLKEAIKMGSYDWQTASEIRSDQVEAVAPYMAVAMQIDQFILALDKLKLDIESWILKNPTGFDESAPVNGTDHIT